jgi:hypothetical protein
MGRHAPARPRRRAREETIVEPQEHVDGNAPEAKVRGARTRRRATAKAPTDAADKRSLNLRVDTETYERLTIHAMKRRTTISDLVMEFAKDHLREFSMPHRIGVRSEQGE